MTWLQWEPGGSGTCDMGRFAPVADPVYEFAELAGGHDMFIPKMPVAMMAAIAALGPGEKLTPDQVNRFARQQAQADHDARKKAKSMPQTMQHNGKTYRKLDDDGLARLNAAKAKRARKAEKALRIRDRSNA